MSDWCCFRNVCLHFHETFHSNLSSWQLLNKGESSQQILKSKPKTVVFVFFFVNVKICRRKTKKKKNLVWDLIFEFPVSKPCYRAQKSNSRPMNQRENKTWKFNVSYQVNLKIFQFSIVNLCFLYFDRDPRRGHEMFKFDSFFKEINSSIFTHLWNSNQTSNFDFLREQISNQFFYLINFWMIS